jgi:uncharacterized protein YbcV (DUF1398 family)
MASKPEKIQEVTERSTITLSRTPEQTRNGYYKSLFQGDFKEYRHITIPTNEPAPTNEPNSSYSSSLNDSRHSTNSSRSNSLSDSRHSIDSLFRTPSEEFLGTSPSRSFYKGENLEKGIYETAYHNVIKSIEASRIHSTREEDRKNFLIAIEDAGVLEYLQDLDSKSKTKCDESKQAQQITDENKKVLWNAAHYICINGTQNERNLSHEEHQIQTKLQSLALFNTDHWQEEKKTFIQSRASASKKGEYWGSNSAPTFYTLASSSTPAPASSSVTSPSLEQEERCTIS